MIRIGKIVATHGLNGTLIFTHVADTSNWLKKDTVLMVEMTKGSHIPYFVTDFKAMHDGEYHIKVEDIETIDKAKKLVGKHVYVAPEALTTLAKTSPLMWIGFTVTDVHEGLLGRLDDVVQSPNQWLGKIMYKENEVLIPLIQPFIKEVNTKAKRVILELPAGLLEVYS